MTIDLNSDLGESFSVWSVGDDAAMLEVVTSANVACGFHAGDASTARRTCCAAASRGVAIGAHVGYRDLAGFGRRDLDIDPAMLADETIYQIGALQAIARAEGAMVRYVKPHGALYNRIVYDEVQATAVVEATIAADPDLAVMGLPGSAFLRIAASRGLRTIREAFADRAYTPEAVLVPRSQRGAVLHDPASIARRALQLVTTGTVAAINGRDVQVAAESVCVHGDTPGAVQIAHEVRRALDKAGIAVQSPWAQARIPSTF